MSNLQEIFTQMLNEERAALLADAEKLDNLRAIARQLAKDELNNELNAFLPHVSEAKPTPLVPPPAPGASDFQSALEKIVAELSADGTPLKDIPDRTIRDAVRHARALARRDPQPMTAELLNEEIANERTRIDSRPMVRAEGPNGKLRLTGKEPKTRKDRQAQARALRQHQEIAAVEPVKKNTIHVPAEVYAWEPNVTHFGDRGGLKTTERSAFIADWKPGEPVYVSQAISRHNWAVQKALKAAATS